MKTIISAFGFTPKTTENFDAQFSIDTKAENAGIRMSIQEGKVLEGQALIDEIRANADKTYLVSSHVFNHLVPLGYKNVCMWDDKLTVRDGTDTIQGGLIFA